MISLPIIACWSSCNDTVSIEMKLY